MNWRKQLPKRAGMYWTRLGADDPQPKVIQVVEDEGLQVIRLGAEGRLPLAEFARLQPPELQCYGPMRIPKTPIPRRQVDYEAPRDPVIERFEKQTDPQVVLNMVNEYLRTLPEETRRKIPRTLKLPEAINSFEELFDAAQRFDEADYAWGMENDTDNSALHEVAHFLQIASFQIEQIAIDAEPFDDPADVPTRRRR